MVTYGEIGTLVAGVVAAVDLTADTEVLVATITMVRDATVHEIAWGFGNVVDAKAATGYLEIKSNLKTGPWRFPVGLGAGGSASTSNKKKGKLAVNIAVQKNEIVSVYMTMNEACVAAHVGIKYTEGKGKTNTYMDCNTVEDAAVTAATLESPGTITIPADKGGRIKKIFVSYADVVNAKTAAGYVDFKFSVQAGEYRFPIGGGMGGATLSDFEQNAEEIDVDIPVSASEVITPWYYFIDAKVNAHIGIMWVV